MLIRVIIHCCFESIKRWTHAECKYGSEEQEKLAPLRRYRAKQKHLSAKSWLSAFVSDLVAK